jgi:DNA-binding PadR family transcriptional regulator
MTACVITVADIYFRNRNMPPLPLTPAVFHILLALAEGPLHGYAIMQSVEESSGTSMGPGTIYGTLERLESGGFVRELPAARSDRRRTFALQPAGRTALQNEARRLSRLAALVRAKRLVPRET